MCGIVGIISNDNFLKNNFKKNLDLISHRGPDDKEFIEISPLLSIGFTRLAIVDSKSKSMPFYDTSSGNYAIFNGEIYNFKQLIKSEGINYSGKSDGEIILPLYKKYGLNFTKILNGMFSIFIFDFQKNKLFLIRDHFGQKPLYYYYDNKDFLFSSEIKSFNIFSKSLSVDNNSLFTYMQFGYVPSPYTIYNNVYKVEPGSIVEFDISSFKFSKSFFYDHYQYKINKNLDYNDAKKELRSKLISSLEKRFQGDYEINFALSGGLDSSILSLIAHKILGKKINTFTIENNFSYLNSSQIKKFNEDSDYATYISDLFNFKNTKVKIDNINLVETLNRTHEMLEEPNYAFQNISLFNLYSQASNSSKVLITGDGSDELFGGYNFLYLDYIYGLYSFAPVFLRKMLFYASNKLRFSSKLNNFLQKGLNSDNIKERYFNWHSVFSLQELKILNSNYIDETEFHRRVSKIFPNIKNLVDQKRQLNDIEFSAWLRDHYCLYVDKLSMASSLELRFPFLDQDFVNFVKTIPFEFRSSKNNRKKILKDAFSDILPQKLIERKKFGLMPPASMWLRNELKKDLYDNIEDAFSDNLIFNFDVLKKIVDNHIDMSEYNLSKVWSIYSLSKFINRNK